MGANSPSRSGPGLKSTIGRGGCCPLQRTDRSGRMPAQVHRWLLGAHGCQPHQRRAAQHMDRILSIKCRAQSDPQARPPTERHFNGCVPEASGTTLERLRHFACPSSALPSGWGSPTAAWPSGFAKPALFAVISAGLSTVSSPAIREQNWSSCAKRSGNSGGRTHIF